MSGWIGSAECTVSGDDVLLQPVPIVGAAVADAVVTECIDVEWIGEIGHHPACATILLLDTVDAKLGDELRNILGRTSHIHLPDSLAKLPWASTIKEPYGLITLVNHRDIEIRFFTIFARSQNRACRLYISHDGELLVLIDGLRTPPSC